MCYADFCRIAAKGAIVNSVKSEVSGPVRSDGHLQWVVHVIRPLAFDKYRRVLLSSM